MKQDRPSTDWTRYDRVTYPGALHTPPPWRSAPRGALYGAARRSPACDALLIAYDPQLGAAARALGYRPGRARPTDGLDALLKVVACVGIAAAVHAGGLREWVPLRGLVAERMLPLVMHPKPRRTWIKRLRAMGSVLTVAMLRAGGSAQFEVVGDLRACQDCGAMFPAAAIGRPRLRCDRCRSAASSAGAAAEREAQRDLVGVMAELAAHHRDGTCSGDGCPTCERLGRQLDVPSMDAGRKRVRGPTGRANREVPVGGDSDLELCRSKN